MFGYVQYDYPNLYVKDLMLYKALYCGLCKGIGASCGQMARLGLTYDVAFLSALLHNIKGVDIAVEQQHCIEHMIVKRPIARADELTCELGALNTVLSYYKLSDDAADGDRRKHTRLLFRRGMKRAQRRYPELVAIVERFMREQAETERRALPSPDMAAEPTACMMRALSEHFLADMGTPDTAQLFYEVGKWIYLIDALDDYEKDAKKGRYNPFVLSFGKRTRTELMEENGEEIAFLFDTMFYSMREHLAKIAFHFNRDLTDNVILRGIPLETKRVFLGKPRSKMTVKI